MYQSPLVCISLQHEMQEELKHLQVKSKQILQKQKKKWKKLGKTLEQIQVRRTRHQSLFMLFKLKTDKNACVLNRKKREKQKTTVRAS